MCTCVCVYVCMCVFSCKQVGCGCQGHLPYTRGLVLLVSLSPLFSLALASRARSLSCALCFARALSRALSLFSLSSAFSFSTFISLSAAFPAALYLSRACTCLSLAHTLVPSSLILPGHLSLSLPPALVRLSISLSVPSLSPSLSSPAPSLASSFSSRRLFLSAKPLIFPGHLVILIRLSIILLFSSSSCDHLTFARSTRISPSVNKGSWA